MLSSNTNLTAAGYTVFIVDEPCFNGRDANGNLVVPTDRWPSGFAGFAHYLHSNGMQLGLYTDQGASTCGGCVGSEGHEAQDMALFVSWGVDYVKVDSCYRPIAPANWQVFESALNASGRGVTFSIIAQGYNGTIAAGASIGNLWRTTNDIMNRWDGVMCNFDNQSAVANVSALAGPGAWNDPDMLQIGNAATWQGGGLTPNESVAHFALWALLKAPLLLSYDAAAAGAAPVAALATHPELIAINQDALGVQASVAYDYAHWYAGGEWLWGSGSPGLSSSLFWSNFTSCGTGGAVSDPSQQVWNFTGSTSAAGWIVSASADLCLVPAGCANASGTPLLLVACDHYPPACYEWSYDFYTTNEWTHVASGLLMQDNGDAPPSVAAGTGGLNQRFAFNPDVPQIMAADSGNCLTAPPPLVTLSGPLVTGAVAFGALNRAQVDIAGASVVFADVGLPPTAPITVRDVLARVNVGNFTGSFPLPTLAPHSVAVYTFAA